MTQIRVRILEQRGHGSQDIVEVVSVGREHHTYPTTVEQLAVLAWAHEHELDTVAFPEHGPYTLRACRDCGEPVDGGPNKCTTCAEFDEAVVAGVQNRGVSTFTYPAQEMEHRAQRAERLSIRYAQLAIELQGLAAAAPQDSIEIVQEPQLNNFEQDFLEVIAGVHSRYQLDRATGEDLDRLAMIAGVSRAARDRDDADETDESLRRRLQSLATSFRQRLEAVETARSVSRAQLLDVTGRCANCGRDRDICSANPPCAWRDGW